MQKTFRSHGPAMFGAISVCLLALTACQTPVSPLGSEVLPEPIAEIEQRELELFFATDQARLDATQSRRLSEFLMDVDPPAGSVVAIAGYADHRAASGYNLALSERRIEAVRQEITALGHTDLQIETKAFGESEAASPPASHAAMAHDRRAVVFVRVFKAVAPPCPNWSRSVAFDPHNLPSSNLGCSTASNLAAMIADPRDLAQGRTLGPNDGAQAIGAIERYRTDEVKELNEELASE